MTVKPVTKAGFKPHNAKPGPACRGPGMIQGSVSGELVDRTGHCLDDLILELNTVSNTLTQT